MQDLIQELEEKRRLLNASVNHLKVSGRELASAERDYKILLRTEILKMRDDGVPVGVIDKTCYGIQSVADLRFKRDCAEAVYKANLEAINTYKLEIRILQEQIKQEWNSGE